jgi:hypothetical protein
MTDPTPTDDAIAALETAHTRSVDARHGFDTMVERAEPGFRPVAQEFRDLHARHAEGLAALLVRHGRTPDADGSFMSTVHSTVVSLRALVDEIDDDVMDAVRSGERRVVDAFEAAEAAGLPEAARGRVAAMRTELEALLHRTRHLD